MAISYENQDWYDETKTDTENYTAFLEAQKIDYTLGDFTGSASGDMEMYTDLKIKSTQEKEKINTFDETYSTERQKIVARHDTVLIEFGKVCQTARESGYDTTLIPDGDTYNG